MTARLRTRLVVAVLLLPAGLAAQDPARSRDPAAEFRELEERLTAAASVTLDYHVTAEGAFTADLRGRLELAADGTTALTGLGTFGDETVDLRLHARDGTLRWGRAADLQEAPTPAHLRASLLIGLTRMGILHNLARLSAGAPPDHAEGGVREWVVVDSFMVAPVDTAVTVLHVSVADQPTATALLISDRTGNPVERRQTVRFSGGEMHVVERYSAVEVVPARSAADRVTGVMGNRGSGHAVVLLTNGHRAHAHLVRLSNLALDLLAEEVRD